MHITPPLSFSNTILESRSSSKYPSKQIFAIATRAYLEVGWYHYLLHPSNSFRSALTTRVSQDRYGNIVDFDTPPYARSIHSLAINRHQCTRQRWGRGSATKAKYKFDLTQLVP